MNLRKAKIICTLGPSSNSAEMIERLMRAGMDVARLNFSHGTQREHARTIARIRAASGRLKKPIAILADLPGPKIRTGALVRGRPVMLHAGQRFTITTADVPGTNAVVSTTFKRLPREVHPGDRILLADGLIELRVLAVRGPSVISKVINGGELGEHKGINLPGLGLRLPALTPKDRKDLAFALRHGADYIAISFVRRAKDVLDAKVAIRRAGKDAPVIAKLEKPEAIENLDEILHQADGVMVARGDLGVEMKPETVPVVQKEIIRKACEARRPVITATQMLESMTQNPRPTRAEASDVANAIFDGTDVVMLSAETAVGRYPCEAVEMMARIVTEAESHPLDRGPAPEHRWTEHLSIAESICEAVAHAAQDLDLRAIAVFTEAGTTARMLSKRRPEAAIYAFTQSETVCNRMNSLWGVTAMRCPAKLSVERMAEFAEEELMRVKALSRGAVFGLIAGTTQSIGATNFLRLITAGENQ